MFVLFYIFNQAKKGKRSFHFVQSYSFLRNATNYQ
jgi:hypothetical protein